MKAIYHLKQLDDGSLGIYINVKTPEGDKSFFCRSRKVIGSLTDLDKVCRANINTVLWKNGLGRGIKYVWDEDPTEIQNMKILGLNTYKKKTIFSEDVSDLVYEVIKVDNCWTVIKHDCPLLTWDEAVTELKKRI